MKNIAIIILMISLSACSLLTKKEDKKEDKADIYYKYGTNKLVEKDYTGALDTLLKAYKLRPEDDLINNNLGMAYYLRGDIKNALKHIKKALTINPTNSDAKSNLASLHFNQNNLTAAKKIYEEVLKDLVYKKQFRTHYNLALINIRQKKFRTAESHLKKSIAVYPDYCPSHFQLGELYLKKHLKERAVEALKEGIKGPCYNVPANHFSLAKALIEAGRNEAAKKRLEYIVEKFYKTKYFTLASMKLNKLGKKSDFLRKARNIYHDSNKPIKDYNKGNKKKKGNVIVVDDFYAPNL